MHNFKKNAKLYIVENGNKHLLEVYSDISASQTFDELSNARKTLHAPLDLNSGASITRANPANFSFTAPLLILNKGTASPILLTLANEYSTGNLNNFDLYFELENVTYKIERSVIDSVTFNIEREAIMTLSISGTGSRFSTYSTPATPQVIPGTLVTYATKDYVVIRRTSIVLGGQQLDSIAALNLEMNNEVSWPSYNTLHSSLANNIAYPSTYVLSGRSTTGSITEFITSENVGYLYDTSTTASLVILIYSDSDNYPIISVNLPSTVFTRRVSFDDLINRVYDFRLDSNQETATFTYGIEPNMELNFLTQTYSSPNI